MQERLDRRAIVGISSYMDYVSNSLSDLKPDLDIHSMEIHTGFSYKAKMHFVLLMDY